MRFSIAILCSIAVHLIVFIKTNFAFKEVVLVTATSNKNSKLIASIVIKEAVEQKEKKKSIKEKKVVKKKKEKKIVKKEKKSKKVEVKEKKPEKKVDQTEDKVDVNQVKSKNLPNSYSSKARMAKAADYLNNPHPKYPLLALRRNQQGTVILQVKIDKSGKVVDLAIKESSGFSLLDSAARKSVSNWRFVPAILSSGEKVKSTVIVPIEYKLRK